MNNFSFLNAAHTSFFAELYDKYLTSPDSIEPSWRAFFQGYDFGMESSLEELDFSSDNGVALSGMPQSLQKEFQVVKLIDGYRTRGHLFTKTNPVRDRRKYSPTLDIENFGLVEADLDAVFTAGEILGMGSATLKEIIKHLTSIYCDAIGVEYMYIRKPERLEWIQNWININDNQPKYNYQTLSNCFDISV